VQPFFVSAEKLAKQAYRYDFRYRSAAFALIAAMALQAPLGLFLLYENRVRAEEENRQSVVLHNKTQLAENLVSFKETETQLKQIESWEPILRGRMPVSAVIGAIEQTIPPEIALSKIAVEAESYRAVPLGSATFRVPENYTITLEGASNDENSRVWEEFVDHLLRRLPPGSRVVSCVADAAKDSKTVATGCKATLQAQANGNYFPLGVSKIDAEGNL
jgi:hypothetical protein